jgi:hypothetical protein
MVAGPIENVRSSVEKFRAKWEKYLNDVDPEDLVNRLSNFAPQPDWVVTRDDSDQAHQQSWEKVATSQELRDLAYDGKNLYDSFFPSGSDLRSYLDSLTPGQRIDISWHPTSGAAWIPHVPWGLMYQTVPEPGHPIDPMQFVGLRFRISHSSYPVSGGSKALGSVDGTYGAHFFYWGDRPDDQTGLEAKWQQEQLSAWTTQIVVPSPSNANSKEQLLELLKRPSPHPMAVLYLFCQCQVGEGNDPVLRFGNTLQASDVIKRTELSQETLTDRPLVFANACTTAAADPYIANELEKSFLFNRGCRAYLGTESKVPIQLASRFAFIFFSFFYREVDLQPMAAGEAVAQTKIFLWTQYRNIGGLFYTYANQYELFMAQDAEVIALRS